MQYPALGSRNSLFLVARQAGAPWATWLVQRLHLYLQSASTVNGSVYNDLDHVSPKSACKKMCSQKMERKILCKT